LKNITKILEEFIRTENTDYALLIDGEWGCGKTFYFKDKLKPELEQLENTNGNKFNVVYVSLNGLSNISSISNEIISSNFGINEKGKLIKLFYSSSDFIFNATSKLLKMDDYLKDTAKIDFAKFINFENKIICFDDIERISPKLSIIDVLGYINTNFVEHNKIKTLIIGNIKKLKDKGDFKEKSEKIIGRTISFFHTYEEIIEIILQKYNQSSEFLTFLNNHTRYIQTLFEKYSITNLRTIFFFTDSLKRYFKEKNDISYDIWEKIILFTLVITIEFRDNEFIINEDAKRKELMELSNTFFNMSLMQNSENRNNEKPPSYSECITLKYFQNYQEKYSFYSSIYNHIVKGFLEIENFIAEFTPSEDKEYTDTLDRLNDYLILTDDELSKDIEIILRGLDKGIYNIYAHEIIFRKLFILLQSDILEFSIEEIQEKMFSSLEKARLRDDDFDEDGLDRYGFYTTTPIPNDKVLLKIKEIHKSYFDNKKVDSVESILSKLEETHASYSDIIHSFLHINLSDFLNVDEIVVKLKTASNFTASKFIRFLSEKYRYDDYKTTADIPFIKEFSEGIKAIIGDTELTAQRKAVLNNGVKILEYITKEFVKR